MRSNVVFVGLLSAVFSSLLAISPAFGEARLVIEGPDQRAEDPLQSGGGSFFIRIIGDSFESVASVLVAVEFRQAGSPSGFFQIQLRSEPPVLDWFSGIAARYNKSVFPNGAPVHFPPYLGVISTSPSTFAGPVWVLLIYFDYSPLAAGTYTIHFANADLLTGLGGEPIPCSVQPGSVTVGRAPVLTVRSEPVQGILIGGDPGRTTDYAEALPPLHTASLTAERTATVAGVQFHFVRWIIDGAPGPEGVLAVDVLMDNDHTAVSSWALLGDLNNDCVVNVLDMILARNLIFGGEGNPTYTTGDVNNDRRVDLGDLLVVRKQFNQRCP